MDLEPFGGMDRRLADPLIFGFIVIFFLSTQGETTPVSIVPDSILAPCQIISTIVFKDV